MSRITPCLRTSSPILQFLRHASGNAAVPRGGKKIGQRILNEKVVVPRPEAGKGTKFSSTPVKATYEPSPIFGAIKQPETKARFGAVKPSSTEALKRPTREPKTSTEKGKAKEEEPIKLLTEDEKQVALQ